VPGVTIVTHDCVAGWLAVPLAMILVHAVIHRECPRLVPEASVWSADPARLLAMPRPESVGMTRACLALPQGVACAQCVGREYAAQW